MPNTDTASPAEASSPRAAPIPLPSMFSRGIDTEAAMRALASLSSRIELSRPTPELALVNLASTVAEQSRQLTEVVLQTIAATRDSATASSASADRLAALEAGLIDLTGKIAQLAAAPVKQPPSQPRPPSRRLRATLRLRVSRPPMRPSRTLARETQTRWKRFKCGELKPHALPRNAR